MFPSLYTNRGYTQDGTITGAFFLLPFSFVSPLFLQCSPPYLNFKREKGSAVPSLVENDIEFCQLTQKFLSFVPSAFDCQLRKVRKNTTLAEIQTRELAAEDHAEADSYRQTDYRGDPAK